jgi:hypothetical protein
MYDTNNKNGMAYTTNNKMNGGEEGEGTGKKDKYMKGEKNLSCCPNLSVR